MIPPSNRDVSMEEDTSEKKPSGKQIPQAPQSDGKTGSGTGSDSYAAGSVDGQHKHHIDNPESGSTDNTAVGSDNVLRRYHRLSHDEGETKKGLSTVNASTVITIGYTVAILVLGFLIYRDISARLDNLEERVARIEASVIERSNLTLDDISIYDSE